jgi:hypothetical protein
MSSSASTWLQLVNWRRRNFFYVTKNLDFSRMYCHSIFHILIISNYLMNVYLPYASTQLP